MFHTDCVECGFPLGVGQPVFLVELDGTGEGVVVCDRTIKEIPRGQWQINKPSGETDLIAVYAAACSFSRDHHSTPPVTTFDTVKGVLLFYVAGSVFAEKLPETLNYLRHPGPSYDVRDLRPDGTLPHEPEPARIRVTVDSGS